MELCGASKSTAAREALKGAELRDGSITAVFEQTGKGKISYSHRTHTEQETRYVKPCSNVGSVLTVLTELRSSSGCPRA